MGDENNNEVTTVSNADSILGSIRKKLGGELFPNPEDTSPFDDELIMDINSALLILTQIGVGVKGFVVIDYSQTWSDFLGEARTDMELVKTDVYLRVRLMFDPPTSSTLVGVINDQIKEYEWRLQTRAEFNA